MEINNKTIAVIIDFDNFNKDLHLQILFNELEQMGNVIYKGAFYTNTVDKDVKNKGIKYGINDFIVEPSYSKGKNAVDIRIALDIMELLNKEYIDCFCLATTDLDFAPIIKKLKQRNKFVIGSGLSSTKEEYKKLCHRFISVDKIEEALEDTKEVKSKNNNQNQKSKIANNRNNESIKELVKIVNLILKNSEKDNEEYIQFSVIIENLYKKIPDFNPKNYGFSNNKPSLFFKDTLKDTYDFKQSNKTLYIKIKK
ncbi:NYN domain-containing protein [Spiroplasma cantharicola]|uniref:HTH OST-type domain-containing protein n=1 Tax=Spiroplasma cantharicola TaxID=362837 RepID=A0A0M4K1B7_9MOLU|nr:NYN domain-containing protein [Spiroplasma cantharicola]ALD66375.1 hypothetical protein SCANT_v1c04690 [Spiroplasma cantharicola]